MEMKVKVPNTIKRRKRAIRASKWTTEGRDAPCPSPEGEVSFSDDGSAWGIAAMIRGERVIWGKGESGRNGKWGIWKAREL